MGGLRGIPKPAVWNDLTRVLGARIAADGEAIEVTGIVTDRECRPLAGAQVEIWQACATGRYAHPRDGNPAALDPNFGYFGIAETDASGRYRFKTIKPGAYPVGGSWVRPSHIHFRVEAPGMRRLTTQMYFAGDPHQDRDGVLMALSSAERRRVIVEPDRPAAPDDAAGAEYRFDLTLLSVST
jgi:protocatechuate 3,4-dioxygenase beta subunit